MVSDAILKLKDSYRNQSGEKIGRDFIQPCLKECTKYRRGTGTFSSSAFKSYIGALDHFIHDDIEIEILCSPKIDFNLYETLKKCNDEKEVEDNFKEIAKNIIKIAAGVKQDPNDQDYRSLLIAYLISTKKLTIKIVQPLNLKSIQRIEESILENGDPDMDDINTRAMYHIKYGYFEFEDNIKVAFDGSVNETDTALSQNIERAQVFRSWVNGDENRLKNIIEELDHDWDGKNEDIKIHDIDNETIDLIKEHVQIHTGGKKPVRAKEKVNLNNQQLNVIDNNQSYSLREYQKKALEKWKLSKYQGILAMATGSGKTITAIHALLSFKKSIPGGFIFIVVPKQDLARQWISELEKNGIKTIQAFESKNQWIEELTNECISASFKITDAPCIVSVVNTFKSAPFKGLIRYFDNIIENNHLLIADECHYFNNEEQIKNLPIFANFRLGLSATPYDQFEQEKEKQYLRNYFGEIVYEYSLKDAINAGNLTPYYYHVIEVSLDDEETDEYLDLSKKIAAFYDSSDNSSGSSVDALLAQRARLIANINDKIAKLKKIANEEKDPYSLVYCGDATTDTGNDKVLKQINIVTKIFNDANWKTSQITFEESSKERKEIIDNFEKKNIEILASIRILDEGIDLPCCRKAYILSSRRSSREHIQRRGRVLRPHKDSGKESAEIYDFVITKATSNKTAIKNLIKNELDRVYRFAEDAINKDENFKKFEILSNEVGYSFEIGLGDDHE